MAESWLLEDWSWQDQASCKSISPTIFFGDHVCRTECDGPKGCLDVRREKGRFSRVAKARTICDGCEVQVECLEFALDTKQAHGIWGGATERERRNLLYVQNGRSVKTLARQWLDQRKKPKGARRA